MEDERRNETMNTGGRAYEDIHPGDVYRHPVGRTITETDIVTHAGQTGDYYPHHMDAEWCRTQTFGQRVAHGTLVFSVADFSKRGPVQSEVRLRIYRRMRLEGVPLPQPLQDARVFATD